MPGKQLGHPHQTRVGQGHGYIIVAIGQCRQSQNFAVQVQGDSQYALLYHSQQLPLGKTPTVDEKPCLNKNGFADQRWFPEGTEMADSPLVVGIIGAEIGNQVTGVEDDMLAHSPKPSIYFGLLA